MKITISTILLILPTFVCGQELAYSEFYDQDYTSSKVTAIQNYNEGVIYVSIADNRESIITMLDSEGLSQRISLGDYEHERAEIITAPNGELYVILFLLKGCDYSPGAILFYNTATEEKTYLDRLTLSAAITELDTLGIHFEFQHILTSSETADSVRQIATYYNGTLHRTTEVPESIVNIFGLDNSLYLVDSERGILDMAGNKLAEGPNGFVNKIEQRDSTIILIAASQLFAYRTANWELIDSLTINPDLYKCKDLNNSCYTYDGDGLTFAGGDGIIYALSKDGSINELYDDAFPELNCHSVYFDGKEYYTAYELGHNGPAVIRKTPKLEEYEFERVDFSLADSEFQTRALDTFYVQSSGDTTFFRKQYLEGTVAITNNGDSIINVLLLHSSRVHELGWDCGYSSIKDEIQTSIERGETYLHSNAYEYSLPTIGKTYYSCYGADYKLDNDLRDNYIESQHSSQTTAVTKSTLSLFPNPSEEEIFINLDKNTAGHLIIYDLNGKVYLDMPTKGESVLRLDINTWSAGVYVLSITTSNSRTSKPFIKL